MDNKKLTEGTVKKGGMNIKPNESLRPSPPKPQTPIFKKSEKLN